jgi:hypothetical protein
MQSLTPPANEGHTLRVISIEQRLLWLRWLPIQKQKQPDRFRVGQADILETIWSYELNNLTTTVRNISGYLEWLVTTNPIMESKMRSILEGLQSGRIVRSADHPLAFFDTEPLWVLCWRKCSPLDVQEDVLRKASGEIWEFFLFDYARPSKALSSGEELVYHARKIGLRTRKGLYDGWDFEEKDLGIMDSDHPWTALAGTEELKLLPCFHFERDHWHLNYSEVYDRAVKTALIKVQGMRYQDVYT